MEVLETIDKVFAYNLRKYRGKRTQSEIAEASGLSLRGYQRLEQGTLPRTRRLMSQVSKALGVQETRLFLDPDLTIPTAEQALAVLSELVNKK